MHNSILNIECNTTNTINLAYLIQFGSTVGSLKLAENEYSNFHFYYVKLLVKMKKLYQHNYRLNFDQSNVKMSQIDSIKVVSSALGPAGAVQELNEAIKIWSFTR